MANISIVSDISIVCVLVFIIEQGNYVGSCNLHCVGYCRDCRDITKHIVQDSICALK